MPRARGKDRALKRSDQRGPAGAIGTDTREDTKRTKPRELPASPQPAEPLGTAVDSCMQSLRPVSVEDRAPTESAGRGPHLAVQFLHGHQIQGLEGVPRGRDEVEADMDPRVMVVEERTADLQLLLQVVFKLRIDIVDYGPVTTDSSITGRQTARPRPRARSPAKLPTSLLSVRTNSFYLGIPAWVQVGPSPGPTRGPQNLRYYPGSPPMDRMECRLVTCLGAARSAER